MIAIFCSTSGHSGVDRAARNLVPELLARGYRVDLLKVRRHGPHVGLEHPRFRRIDLGTRHTYLAIAALVRYLRRERPAALYSDKDRVNRTSLLARWLAGATTTRLVLSTGTTVSMDLSHRRAAERWIQRHSMGRLYRHADQVLVPSTGVADDMAAYTGLPRRLIAVAPRPVVPDALIERQFPRPDHPWFRPGEPPVILGTGALVQRKGFDTLVRAFALLHRARPCRLLILGKGGQREALLALAAELGVAQDVDLPGYVEQPYAYMAHAAQFVLTSRWEGLGFVLIEALAVGTPVVSVDCPSGPAEILDRGRYGPLVPVDDETRLAAAMDETLERPPPAHALRQAAHRYTVSASTDAYLAAMGLPARASADPPAPEPRGI